MPVLPIIPLLGRAHGMPKPPAGQVKHRGAHRRRAHVDANYCFFRHDERLKKLCKKKVKLSGEQTMAECTLCGHFCDDIRLRSRLSKDSPLLSSRIAARTRAACRERPQEPALFVQLDTIPVNFAVQLDLARKLPVISGRVLAVLSRVVIDIYSDHACSRTCCTRPWLARDFIAFVPGMLISKRLLPSARGCECLVACS